MEAAINPEPELLNGIEEIAAFFGWPPRRAHYLLSAGKLPCAFRIGDRRWHMRPATARLAGVAGTPGGRGAAPVTERHCASFQDGKMPAKPATRTVTRGGTSTGECQPEGMHRWTYQATP